MVALTYVGDGNGFDERIFTKITDDVLDED